MQEAKKNILICESISHIAGGQMVLLNNIDLLKTYFNLQVIAPDNGPLTKKLNEKDIKIAIINSGHYKSGKKKFFHIVRYVSKIPQYIHKINQHIKKSDLIYVNSVRVLPLIFISNILHQKPIIWHNHHLITDKKIMKLVKIISRRSMVKKIINVSKAVQIKDRKINNKNVVIYNGVNLEKFYPQKHRNEILKIGILGDIIPEKGHTFLIEALSELKSYDWELQIIGEARQDTVKYKEALKQLIENKKITSRIKFLNRQENPVEYLQKLDLLVVPSKSFEAFGLVIIEAMACGVPCIASDLGGTKEIIIDGYNGYLYQNSQLDSFKEALIKFFNLPNQQINILSQNCRKTCLEKFPLDIAAKKVISEINSVL